MSDEFLEKKLLEIKKCLDKIDRNGDTSIDLWELRHFALTKGGYIDNTARERAWGHLVGCRPCHEIASHGQQRPPLSQEQTDIVKKDSRRSIWNIFNERESILAEKKGHKSAPSLQSYSNSASNSNDNPQNPPSRSNEEINLLSSTIVSILQSSPDSLNYYQGFHDITALFLINIPPHLTTSILCKVAQTHLIDFFKPDFQVLNALLQIVIPPLLQKVDPDLHDYLLEELGEDHNALSLVAIPWVLSWFCHNIKLVGLASRIVDVCLASHPLMPLYMSVAMLIHPINRDKISRSIEEHGHGSLYLVLNNLLVDMVALYETPIINEGHYLPSQIFEELIEWSLLIMRKVPPNSIIPLAQKYRNGVLQPLLQEHLASIHLLSREEKHSMLSSTSKSQLRKIGSYYPHAVVAAGHADCIPRKLNERKKRFRLVLFVLIVVMALVVLWNYVCWEFGGENQTHEGRDVGAMILPMNSTYYAQEQNITSQTDNNEKNDTGDDLFEEKYAMVHVPCIAREPENKIVKMLSKFILSLPLPQWSSHDSFIGVRVRPMGDAYRTNKYTMSHIGNDGLLEEKGTTMVCTASEPEDKIVRIFSDCIAFLTRKRKKRISLNPFLGVYALVNTHNRKVNDA